MDEANNLLKDKNYRLSNTYLIIGNRKLMNDVYRSLTDKIIPTIPPYINDIIEEHHSRDEFYQRLMRNTIKPNKTNILAKDQTNIQIIPDNINQNEIVIKDYSSKSILITGEKTKQLINSLKELGGKSNRKLSGWILAKTKRQELERLIKNSTNTDTKSDIDVSFSIIPSEIINEHMLPYLQTPDIINLCLLNKDYSNICNDINVWKYLLKRDFNDTSPVTNIQQARQKYFVLNGHNIDYQTVSNKSVWKPKIGDFVSYSAGSDSYSNIVTNIHINDKGIVDSATIKDFDPSSMTLLYPNQTGDEILLKRGKYAGWITSGSKGQATKYQTTLRPDVLCRYLDPNF